MKELKPIWLSNNHTLNKKFKITTKQGASGIAYSEGVATIVNLPKSINSLNLNQKQISSISGNGFVISYPIFAFDQKYKRLGTKIIGVVTLSCSNLGSESIIEEQANRAILTEKITDFSRICSLIM